MTGHEAIRALGADLSVRRAAGEPFEEAWEKARGAAVSDLAPHDREMTWWALFATQGAWERAYERRPPTPGEAAVARAAVMFESVEMTWPPVVSSALS